MSKINAVITGVGGYVPDYVLTNEELSKIVDTNDEWITTRVGIKERRILKDTGKGASYLATRAVAELFAKTGTQAEQIDLIICATTTADHIFPSCASMIAEQMGIKNAFAFDIQVACSGFISALQIATAYIESGKYKKILAIASEKMSALVDYTDRATAPLFGDGAAAVLVEPTTENLGIIDSIIHTDGSGFEFLNIKAGGSAYPSTSETVARREHYIHQEGQSVFKNAVLNMAEVSAKIMEKNHLGKDDVDFIIPHQANLRIIDAVAHRTGVSYEKLLINIERYGNTSAATIPLCIWDFEKKLHKGDNIILTSFGAGFSWGAVYLKWGYDTQ